MSTTQEHQGSHGRDVGQKVSWEYHGRADALVGTGATAAERALSYGSAFVLMTLIVGADLMRENPIAVSGLQMALLAIFAFDIAGGAVANMLNSCKRLYHSRTRPEDGVLIRGLKNPILFTAIHIHPVVIAWALDGSVAVGVIWYLALQLAVWGVLAAPLYLRRPLATAMVMLAVAAEQLFLPLGAGLAWVIPALFLKMVLAHAVQEEPYAAQSKHTTSGGRTAAERAIAAVPHRERGRRDVDQLLR